MASKRRRKEKVVVVFDEKDRRLGAINEIRV